MRGIDRDSFAHISSYSYLSQVANSSCSARYSSGMDEERLQAWRVERLRAAIKQLTDGNITAFGKQLGFRDGAYIGQMLRGDRPISEKTIRAVEGLPGLAAWFSGTPPSSGLDLNEPRPPTDDEFALVPQLDVKAACGTGKFVDHVVVKGGLAFKRTSLKDFGVTEKTARIIYASGNSMAPLIQDGCVVLINTADIEPKDGKVYAVCTPEGGLVLKRLIRDYHPGLGAQAWIMRSDNPDKSTHPDKLLPPDDRTMIVGRAIWNDNRL